MFVFSLLIVLSCTPYIIIGSAESFSCANNTDDGISCVIQDVEIHRRVNFTITEGQLLSSLYFVNSTVLFMPEQLFTVLKNLQILYMPYSNLSKLSKYDFSNAIYLKEVILHNNIIKELSEWVFDGAGQLEDIDLRDNAITKIHEDAFANLFRLQRLQLAGNKLKVLPVNLFINNLSLRHLDLGLNLLRSISQELIGNLDLEIFGVDLNQLEFLEIGNNVKKLIARHNKLTTENLHINSSSLEYLDLAYNRLTSVDFIRNLTSLIGLDLSSNPLSSDNIRDDTFTTLTKLIILRLNSIDLTELNFEVFSNLQYLEVLDISDNRKLSLINFNSTRELPNLNVLYLNGLNITDVPVADIVQLLPNLEFIDISNNIQNSNLQSITDELYRLNIDLTSREDESREKMIDVLNDNRNRDLTESNTHQYIGNTNLFETSLEETDEVMDITGPTDEMGTFIEASLKETNNKINNLEKQFDKLEMDFNSLKSYLNTNRVKFFGKHTLFVLLIIGFGIILAVIIISSIKCNRNYYHGYEPL